MAANEVEDLVRLAEYSSDLEAQIDAAALRSAGIQAEVRNNGSYMPMPGFGISLYVFAGDLIEAQALLALSQPPEPAHAPEATWRRSQSYVYVRLAMRIGLAIYLLLAIYSLITR
jgi:hypothetical protein